MGPDLILYAELYLGKGIQVVVQFCEFGNDFIDFRMEIGPREN